jgi:outer membrane protein
MSWLVVATPVSAEDAAPAPPESGSDLAGGEGLTLLDALAAALAGGHAAEIARLEASRSEDLLAQERSAFLPRASVTSSAGYNNRQDEKLEAVNGTYGLSNIGSNDGWFNVYLDQLLLDLAAWERIERAELEAEASDLARQQEQQAVAFEIVQRFTDVVRQERLAALARERVALTETLDQQAALLLKAGQLRPADREQVALLLEEARLEADSRALDVGKARGSLALVMGREGAVLAQPLDVSSLPDTTSGPPDEPDVTASPELRVLDLRRRVEEKSVDIARAGYFPTLGVRGGYSNYGVKRFDNYPDAVQVGVNVDIPVFQGFKVQSAVEGASKGAEIARLRYRQALERKRAVVRDLTERLASALQGPALAARRASIAREQMRLAELNLRAQRGTLDEALAALDALVRDTQRETGADLDRVLIWAQLHRETGSLASKLGADPPSSQN